VETKKFNNRYLLSISLVTAMGGLLFSYDWVVIGRAKPLYKQFFGIAGNPSLQGWAVSCVLIGCILGAILSGILSDKYGRKNLLIFASVMFTISAMGTGAANQFNTFVWYQIIGGVGIGLASNLSPMYIAEVTPAKVRGKYVSINQLTIVFGILAAQIANYLIADRVTNNDTAQEILASWNGQTGWRWMFWAEVVPAGLFFLLMWFVPESPRFLAKAHKHDKVLSILTKIGGSSYAKNATIEIEESLKSPTQKVNWKDILSPKILAIALIGIVIAAFQQWCGINVIFMYADEIDKRIKIEGNHIINNLTSVSLVR